MTVENVPTTCEQIKAIGALSISSTAKYVAQTMLVTGKVSVADLVDLTGLPRSTIFRAKADYAAATGSLISETPSSPRNETPTSETGPIGETASPTSETPTSLTALTGETPSPISETAAPSRTRAHFETPSGLVSSKKDITHTSTVETEAARVGETELAHGVFVNCQTIRHRNFTISLGAVAMQVVRTGLSSDEIKTRCTAHALQWAAEIEGGKHPDRAVPQKIANFLSASIMGDFNRAEVQTVRLEKAKSTPAKSASANPRGTVEPGPLGRLLRQKMQAQETVQ